VFSNDLEDQARRLLAHARAKRLMIATAESCTGGLIAGLLTGIPGSSDVVDRGFVTYSNAAKTRMLGVPTGLIGAFGAVSAPVARAMAEGAVRESDAHIAVAVTGVAGPGGGTIDKPVGLVHLACARGGGETRLLECRFGDIGRGPVRLATVEAALELLDQAVDAS
jgi:nicotinamide-nucleotide amidase